AIAAYQKVSEGETVILAHPPRTQGAIRDVYYIVDKYRLPSLGYLTLVFFALAIYFGGRRGVTAILGLVFSILIIFYFIIPHILNGGDPLKVCLVGSFAIVLVSLYLSHGFNKRTSIAVVSSIFALALAVGVDFIFVHFAKLSGAGTEEAFYLQFGSAALNLRGILLGGIILGVLGVLDDVTTGQAAAVEEIHLANSNLKFTDLYTRGLSVGREHITSLVNTLVLAYVGASFPLLLLYNSQKLQPVWIVVNSNFMAEEIVRTLVGSAVLVVAVPLTTFLAATFYSNKK
ncbi:MAG: YibE/F family protein, partial [Candidatus Magasanikbacteria bacterium]|nr:YibE/F family protein [Candidatus Magasanikbacteria bacterium]